MNAKHTLGPWIAERGGTVSAQGRVVATCGIGMQHNAALIAAAPTLLEVCEEALRCAQALCDTDEWPSTSCPADLVDVLSRAIDAATDSRPALLRPQAE